MADYLIVEGEKRYWLHPPPSRRLRVKLRRAMDYGEAGIALARDLKTDRTVDVLGSQLEEVSE